MNTQKHTSTPDPTAVRTALWRALHLQVDAPPHIIDDTVGLQLIEPEQGWQDRPDMRYTKRLRASIVARARYIDDFAVAQFEKGIKQYVLLGAGLDSFAQRHKALMQRLHLYEIDQPNTLNWKKTKLEEKGYPLPNNLHFVGVDFETSSWWDALLQSGFQKQQPAFLSCTGVSLYLSKEAIKEILKTLSMLARGSTMAIAFYLPLDLLDAEDQPLLAKAMEGAAASDTPFKSFFPPKAIEIMAKEAGLKNIKILSTVDMKPLYFKDRSDGLSPASGEYFLLASV